VYLGGRMRNQTKDKLLILGFMFLVLFMFVFLVFSIISLITKKAEATEINYNKFMTEERIKAEMYHNSVCELIDSMTDEEYYDTFLRGE
jgi:hypothetical protein